MNRETPLLKSGSYRSNNESDHSQSGTNCLKSDCGVTVCISGGDPLELVRAVCISHGGLWEALALLDLDALGLVDEQRAADVRRVLYHTPALRVQTTLRVVAHV